MTKQIKLGNTARDIASGFQGIVTSSVEFLTGTIQLVVQPPTKDGAYVDPISYDVQQLDFVDEGIASRVTKAPIDTGIKLGENVEDIVTGSKGIATRKNTFMNGCVYYNIVDKVLKDGSIKEDFIEYKRLKVTGKGVVAQMKKFLPTLAAESKTGGPVTRQMTRG